MSHKIYPRVGNISRRTRTGKDGETLCNQCKKKITPGDMYARMDLQHSFFRGDDLVLLLCMDCMDEPLNLDALMRAVS